MMIWRPKLRRLALAWHVLRGRPLAYRLEIAGDLLPCDDLWLFESTITNIAGWTERPGRGRRIVVVDNVFRGPDS